MGTTSISANMDYKIINCAYYRDIEHGESFAPVDLTVSVKHQYVTSANIANEIVLEQFIIPKEYLETTGLMGATPVEQKVEFHALNLRYLDNIFIEIQEVREGIPLLTRVPILNSDDERVDPLPDNPEKYDEFEENIPEVVPDRNISIQKTDVGIIYSLRETDLQSIQTSKRIYMVEENGEQIFVELDYNEEGDQLFIENSINNLAPNPSFTGTTGIPDLWEIDAPGMTLNSYILEAPIENTKIWKIRASNPNIFSAFNSIALKTIKSNLYTGLTALTFSVYYKLKCEGDIPFNKWVAKFSFYYNDDYIRSEEIIGIVAPYKNKYNLIVFPLGGMDVPLTANKYSFELIIDEIDSTDLFDLEFYLPQMEASSWATTRTLDARVEDKYITGKIFELNLPFYLLIKTHYIPGIGARGLVASTTNQKSGFEFLSSNDRLRFKWYDSSGSIVLNIASAPIPPTIHTNDVLEYGLWVTETTLEFYMNGMLLSSHANTINIDQNQSYIVGSLEKSNTTINSELLDFRILRSH
jgi:hypothetical protein